MRFGLNLQVVTPVRAAGAPLIMSACSSERRARHHSEAVRTQCMGNGRLLPALAPSQTARSRAAATLPARSSGQVRAQSASCLTGLGPLLCAHLVEL